MKRPSFLHGALTAAVLAFAAAAVVAALAPYVGTADTVRLAIPGIALAYLVQLVKGSGTRTGVVVTLAAWCGLAVLAWWAEPRLAPYILIHAGAIWLVRSLYYYSGLLPAFIDLGLSLLAICAFAWAGSRTGSVFLATWSFFLVQALHVVIPRSVRQVRDGRSTDPNPEFERARRQADEALRQLAAR